MPEKLFAFKTTIPIMLGYLAIGCAFGLIIHNAGYPWYVVMLMSLLMYAGAGQYAATGMFASGAGYIDIAIAIFLINSRHMVYGLSLLVKFSGCMPYTPYLIFGLTDETYGLLTTTKIPAMLNKAKTYFWVTLFDHSYWVIGGIIGFFIGAAVPFDFYGVDFALTALFIVLLTEQWKSCPEKPPFILAGLCAVTAALFAGGKNMLIVSFVMSLTGIMLIRRWVEKC
ncbi:MAG: AzlC family ABC transporter permease [Deferribacteraceae bacterium]|jgi:4-azaleucine resistance transporter AzlC|nr:AzlC family ABC transporter permease [Deferribacteraceae bacterium]